MSGRWTIAVVATTGIAAALSIRVCVSRAEHAHDVEPVLGDESPLVAREGDSVIPVANDRAELPVSQPQFAAPKQTAREFLAEYYGVQWPEIEAKIEEEGGTLDVPFELTPWEQVEAEFEAQMRPSHGFRERRVRRWLDWPDVLTAEALADRFQAPEGRAFDAADVSAIDALVAETNLRIRERAEYLADLVEEQVRRKWITGDFVRAPFTTRGVNAESGFYSKSTGGYGWAVALTLTDEEYPEYSTLQDEMYELRDQREARIVDYLRNRYGR